MKEGEEAPISSMKEGKQPNASSDKDKKTPKKNRKGKSSTSPRNKENSFLQVDYGDDWRDSDPKKTDAKAAQSKGISPKQFHGDSSRTRSRPGKEFVSQVHATTKDHLLQEEKRELKKLRDAKWYAFKEVTSLKTCPLQDMAMTEYQRLLQEYLGVKVTSGGEVAATDTAAEGDYYEHGFSSSESGASTDRKLTKTDNSISPSKSQQKQKYRNEFLEERRIPPHNVVTPDLDLARRFDPGLWSMEPRIFSTEKAHGKRKYMVGHMGRIADHMWQRTERCNRHFYELILEDTPCRCYFDIEFSIPDNPGVPTDDLLDEFYQELVEAFQTQFPEHSEGFDRTCIVDMDSSTPQKFSRHWIVHLPSKALFRSSHEVGKFVKAFIQQLADEVATGQLRDRCPCLQEYLFVNPKGTAKDDVELPLSKKTCFVDLGVYTRNRLFRLLGSSKFGKSPECALRLADTNEFPLPKGFGNESFYVPAMTQKLDPSDDKGENDDDSDDMQRGKAIEKYKAQRDWSLHAQVLCRTLVVPLNVPKIDYPLLPEIQDESKAAATRQPTPVSSLPSNNSTRPTFGESPYPYIDEFVLNVLAAREGRQGSIRAWTLCYGARDDDNNNDTQNRFPIGISFQMLHNRWCECVGRHHKSNNVIWNISFRTKRCVQSCYDPECRAMNFRGTPVELPYDVVEKLDDDLFEERIAQMDEQELLRVNTTQGPTKGDTGDIDAAMKALTLGGGSGQGAKPVEGNNPSEEFPPDDFISDDALLEAVNANPELFP